MISIVHTELGKMINEHAGLEYAPDIPNNYESVNAVKHTDSFGAELTPIIEIGEHRIEAVKFID